MTNLRWDGNCWELHCRVWVFLRRGWTKACLRVAGKMPVCSDKWHKWQMTGAICSVICFSNQVGTGSREQDLAGVFVSSLRTSCSVTGSKDDIDGTWRGVMTGGVADAVDDLILDTLTRKHAAKSSAESLSGACGRVGCSNSFTVCHNLR